jgi:hypothetical protein
MNQPAVRPDRTLLAIVAIIAVLVIVALVVVFTRGTPAQLDETTPQGVVQRYATAVLDRDEDAAADYVTDDALEDCGGFPREVADNVRMTLVSTDERESSATVRVSIVTTYDAGPFGVNDYEAEGIFDLVEDGGEWLIRSAPWEFTLCSDGLRDSKGSL